MSVITYTALRQIEFSAIDTRSLRLGDFVRGTVPGC